MKVSVVIPVYNEEKYIGACLDSLVKQTVPPDEIIVVDNNSTDKTLKIIQKYPVRIVTEKKQGMTLARNRGFEEAKYEIIARTDADTILPVDWIKRIKENFESKDIIALSGASYFYDLPEITQSSKWSIQAMFKVHMAYFRILGKLLKHQCLYGPNMALRKSGWEKVKKEICLDDNKVHEDLDLAIHLASYGKIKFDYSLSVQTSFRRWKKFQSYFEYTHRTFKSITAHKQIMPLTALPRVDK